MLQNDRCPQNSPRGGGGGFRLLAHGLLVGKEFHNLGAAIVNERSPSVRYDLHTGVLSKSSLVDHKIVSGAIDWLNCYQMDGSNTGSFRQDVASIPLYTWVKK